MQKKTWIYTIFWLLLVMTSSATAIMGREAVLRLSVAGMIKPPPEWRDALNKVIQSLDFEFSGVSDSTNPNRERDSKISQAKLVNAWSESVLVKLERPQQCRIGMGHIRDMDVIFLHNKTAYASDGELSFPAEKLQDFAIRFRGAGNAELEGSVSCAKNGTLTYIGL
jgi:hypothetical protein